MITLVYLNGILEPEDAYVIENVPLLEKKNDTQEQENTDNAVPLENIDATSPGKTKSRGFPIDF